MGGKRAPSFLTDADLLPEGSQPKISEQRPLSPDVQATLDATAAARHERVEVVEDVVATQRQAAEEKPPERPPYADALSAAMTELGIEPSGDEKKDFVRTALGYAKQIEAEFGIPHQVVVAQACLESGTGDSEKARAYFMFFGVKAQPDYQGLKTPGVPTKELDDAGQEVDTTAEFRAYPTIKDAFWDYANVLKKDRYAEAFKHKDNPRQFLDEVLKAGYAGKRDTVEKRNRYIDAAEAKLKPYDLTLNPTEASTPASEPDTNQDEDEGEKTLWGSLVAGLGSMKDAVVQFFGTVGDKLREWFGLEPREKDFTGDPLRTDEQFPEATSYEPSVKSWEEVLAISDLGQRVYQAALLAYKTNMDCFTKDGNHCSAWCDSVFNKAGLGTVYNDAARIYSNYLSWPKKGTMEGLKLQPGDSIIRHNANRSTGYHQEIVLSSQGPDAEGNYQLVTVGQLSVKGKSGNRKIRTLTVPAEKIKAVIRPGATKPWTGPEGGAAVA